MSAAGTITDDQTTRDEPDVVQIKRYPNRRFYDRTRRRYITLQEIEELVHRGRSIDVRDSKSDEDLTRVVLTQILLERHPERIELFHVDFLHLMLRANDLALEFLRVFLRLSLATLENLQRSGALSPFVSPFDWLRVFMPGPGSSPRQGDEPPGAGVSVELLSRRVAELEARIRQLESGRDQPPAPAAPEDRTSR